MASSPSSRTRSKVGGKGLSQTQVLYSTQPNENYTVDDLLSPQLLINDNKRPLKTSSFLKFATYLGIVTPLYLTTLVPTLIVSQIFTQVSAKFFGSGAPAVEKKSEDIIDAR